MNRFRVSARAHQDLTAIWRYYSQFSVRTANKLVSTLVKQFRSLARFPAMGSLWEDLATNLRYFVTKKHVIFYRTLDAGVEIIRVLHAAQDFPSKIDEGI